MNFAELIKSRRIELGLTLEEVARVVGVSKSTILKWERGDINNPRRDRIALLASVLQLPPVALIKETCGLPEDYPIKKEEAHQLKYKLAADAGVELFAELSAADLVNVRELCTLYNSLNDAGKSLLMTTAESFAANPSLQQAPPAASVS